MQCAAVRFLFRLIKRRCWQHYHWMNKLELSIWFHFTFTPSSISNVYFLLSCDFDNHQSQHQHSAYAGAIARNDGINSNSIDLIFLRPKQHKLHLRPETNQIGNRHNNSCISPTHTTNHKCPGCPLWSISLKSDIRRWAHVRHLLRWLDFIGTIGTPCVSLALC